MIETKEDPRLNVRFDQMYKKSWTRHRMMRAIILFTQQSSFKVKLNNEFYRMCEYFYESLQ